MKKKVAVITGIASQDGAYLADFLLKKNYQVIGISLAKSQQHLWRLNYFGISDRVRVIQGDVYDDKLVRKVFARCQLDEFYNLAAQSSVERWWKEPTATHKINTLAVINILEIIRKYSSATKFFQASSSSIYGDSKELITEEEKRFNPINPYGVSKLSAHLSVINFRERYGLFAVNGILFNHTSPLQEDYMVVKKIISVAVKIKLKKQKDVKLGNLQVKRDWGYAKDYAEAMWLMLQNKRPEDFIICTDQPHDLIDLIKQIFLAVGLKDWRKYVKTDPALVRKDEIKQIIGSPNRIYRRLGWRPRVSFKELVKLMVDYEISKYK